MDFFGVHLEKAAPPLFKFQKSIFFSVNAGKQVVEFFPIGVCRIQILEPGHEVCPVEMTFSEIAPKRGQPDPATQPAFVTHWIGAFDATPV